MHLPLYQGLQAPDKPAPATMNMGLWFERYFNAYNEDFSKIHADSPKNSPEKVWSRSDWLRQFATRTLGDSATIKDKAARMDRLARARGGQSRVYTCDGNFVTGMGNPHPLENGFTWHPTLAMPYLPGSAVKGLVRALVETAYAGDDKNAVLKRWFGTEKKGDVAEASGCFIFFDALPVAPCELYPEIMTPHMGKWYEKGGKTPQSSEAQPADWHSPVPVAYLVARKLKLQFSIAPRAGSLPAERLQEELANVWQALDKALEWLGAGAKTALGFGRMESEERQQTRSIETAEHWEGVRLKYNRGSGALSVEKNGKSASAPKEATDQLLKTLSADLQQKIRNNQCFDKFNIRLSASTILSIEKA